MKYSFIIQYFNHRKNIIKITESLINIPESEVIFHNDSNSDHDIFNELIGKYSNLKVICSGDIHEIRGYNKCIPECKGEYIFICQDDDIISDISFISNAEKLFNKYSFLGIVSFFKGGIYDWGLESEMYKKIDNNKIQYSIDNLNTQFIMWGNIGPFMIKRTVIKDIGMFDLEYSKVGELGIGFDSEYTFRANLHGYRVMLLEFNGIKRHVGGKGTMATKEKQECRAKQKVKNREIFRKQYSNLVDNEIDNINSLNIKYLKFNNNK